MSSFTFIGVQAQDKDGTLVQISAYISPDEGGTAEEPRDVLTHARALAEGMGLTILKVNDLASSGGNADSRSGAEGEIQVHDVGALVRFTQKNPDRDKPGQITSTPAIMLFPVWNEPKTYGKFALDTHYLNNANDVAAFEEATGQTVEGLPLYNGKGYARNPDIPEDFEVNLSPPVKAAFTVRILRNEDGTPQLNDKGKVKTALRFHHWVAAA